VSKEEGGGVKMAPRALKKFRERSRKAWRVWQRNLKPREQKLMWVGVGEHFYLDFTA
jgi:hypothetical protein